jgi:hypothetical protein
VPFATSPGFRRRDGVPNGKIFEKRTLADCVEIRRYQLYDF